MIELPRAVLKTRSLLNLRFYSINEVLEYENKFVMYPEREIDGQLKRYTVWVLREPTIVGVALIRDLAREMEETDSVRGMLVGGSRFTPAAKKIAISSRIELIVGNYSSFDLFEHELVPKHIIASNDEVQLVLNHYGIKKNQLPRIFRDDPAVKVLGANPGEIIRVERDSPTAGLTYYYRLVVDSSSN